MEPGRGPGAPPLEVIFYQPGVAQSDRSNDPRTRWEKYTDRIIAGLSSSTPDAATLVLKSLPPVKRPGESILQTVRRLGEDAAQDENKLTSRYKGILLATICIVLEKLGYNSAEELEQALGSISDSSSTRYLATLTRGARLVNEITTEWVAQYGDDSDPRLIGLTSSAVFEGTYSAYLGTTNSNSFHSMSLAC